MRRRRSRLSVRSAIIAPCTPGLARAQNSSMTLQTVVMATCRHLRTTNSCTPSFSPLATASITRRWDGQGSTLHRPCSLVSSSTLVSRSYIPWRTVGIVNLFCVLGDDTVHVAVASMPAPAHVHHLLGGPDLTLEGRHQHAARPDGRWGWRGHRGQDRQRRAQFRDGLLHLRQQLVDLG